MDRGNKRYLTVNVHFSGADYITLGMIRVWGTLGSPEAIKSVVRQQLDRISEKELVRELEKLKGH